MFKNFCRCNAAVSDLYDGKSKSKNCRRIFFLIPVAALLLWVFSQPSQKKKKKEEERKKPVKYLR